MRAKSIQSLFGCSDIYRYYGSIEYFVCVVWTERGIKEQANCNVHVSAVCNVHLS